MLPVCFGKIWSADLVFDSIWLILKFVQEIIKANILIKFQEDWKENVAPKA